jgi:hypothetical protein
MKINKPLIRHFLLIASSLFAASQLQAQISIAGGDLYVFQAGDGVTTAGSGVAAPAFIDQFNTSVQTGNGFIAQTVLSTTPASAGGNFLSQGQGQQDGQISYNTTANTLVFGGYSGMAVNASLNSSAVANRDIGTVNAGGAFSFAVQNAAEYGANNSGGGLLRGAVTDGSGNYWASGSAGSSGLQGVWYYGSGTPAALIGNGTASRALGIYGGNLFYTSGSGLSMITGMPTSGTQTPTLLNSLSGTPYGFGINPTTMTTVYVANEAGGIIKLTYSGTFSGGAYSGGTWSTTTLDSGTKFDWLSVNWSNPGDPVVYATTLAGSSGNSLDSVDGITGTITTLDTITGTSSASGNYDGVAFVPTPEPSVLALVGLGLVLCIGNWRRIGKAKSA